MTLLQDHYPERLGTSLMVNPPWYIYWLFKVVAPFMSASTMAKVKVLGHGEELRKQILEFIAEDQLDACYGGARVADFSLPPSHRNDDSTPPLGARPDEPPAGCPPADQHFVTPPATRGLNLSLDPPDEGDRNDTPANDGVCSGGAAMFGPAGTGIGGRGGAGGAGAAGSASPSGHAAAPGSPDSCQRPQYVDVVAPSAGSLAPPRAASAPAAAAGTQTHATNQPAASRTASASPSNTSAADEAQLKMQRLGVD
jgi:hypothetical protein